jgi:protein TonB
MPEGRLTQLEDHRYYWRLLLVTVLGGCCALLLTWFMHQLIASSQQRLDESNRPHMVDIVRLKRDESSAVKERKPMRPTPSEAPPAPSAPQSDQADTTIAVSSTALPLGIGDNLSIGGLGMSSSDGEYLPIVKVAPIYPKRAALKGIEGSCTVSYSVTTNGSTRDVVVVKDMCTDAVFYRSSVEAAKKFKYKPRVIDGEAIEVHNVSNRFIYELEDQ